MPTSSYVSFRSKRVGGRDMRGTLGVAIVLALALSASSVAAKLYVYTGLQYAGASGVYTSSMRITGTFTTADPWPANMPLTPIGPGGLNLVTGWSFTDCVNTLTNNNSTLLYGGDGYFLVSTDEMGRSHCLGLVSCHRCLLTRWASRWTSYFHQRGTAGRRFGTVHSALRGSLRIHSSVQRKLRIQFCRRDVECTRRAGPRAHAARSGRTRGLDTAYWLPIV